MSNTKFSLELHKTSKDDLNLIYIEPQTEANQVIVFSLQVDKVKTKTTLTKQEVGDLIVLLEMSARNLDES